MFRSVRWRRCCLNQIGSWQTNGCIWRKERLDNEHVKNTISSQHEKGGFLAALAGLIPFLTGTVLPASGVGALSRLASLGVQKLIGNGLYLKKGGSVCQIETDGRGLYLGLASGKGFESLGNGLYLMKQGRLYDGRGLILGPNSSFKNIPIHGMILRYYFQKKNIIH